ncbi:MAG: patatin-like phospholipase family protein [Cyanobacteria bacterium P01_G01_bin.54]
MTFKILSLDGGGIRGVVSATLLQEVEKIITAHDPGKTLHEYFDLITGTSTGSILAAGIVCQRSATELVNLYQKRGREIFLESVRQERDCPLYYLAQLPIPELFVPFKQFLPSTSGQGYGLYPNMDPTQGLRHVLQNELRYQGKHPKIGELQGQDTNLLILAYDVYSRNTTWFSNDPEAWFKDLPLWQVCAASAAAPTFFPPITLPYKGRSLPHIDGGVSANNPTLSAIAHALWIHPTLETRDIAILSIGTGHTTKAYPSEEVENWGLLNWATNISNIFIDPGAKNSEDIGRQILNSIESPYLRLDFDLNIRSQQGQVQRQYNKYLYQKTGGQYKVKINESIDDPGACPQLVKATNAYIDIATVDYMGEKLSICGAIERFICDN